MDVFFSALLQVLAPQTLGVMLLGATLTGYLFRTIPMVFRICLGVTSLMMVTPGLESTLWGAAIAGPLIVAEFLLAKRSTGARHAALAAADDPRWGGLDRRRRHFLQ